MIIAGIVVLFVLITLFKFGGLDIYATNAINNTKLPKKYEGYHDINSENIIRFGRYEMKLIFKSFEPVRHFISSQNNLIVITSQIPKDRNAKEVEEDQYSGGNRIYQDFITYKLNKDGDIIDNYIYKRSSENYTEILFGDYIVNTKQQYYKTWVLDGNAHAKPFVTQNKDLQWNEAQQVNLFQKITNEAKYYKIIGNNYKIDGNNPEQEIIYFLKDAWYKLFTNCVLPNRENADNQRGETTYLSNLFGQYSSNEWGNVPDWHNFQPVYFQRIKMGSVTHNIGGGSPSTDEMVWNGNLFCHLYVDRDTLKFKKPMVFGKLGETKKFFEAKAEKIEELKDELEKYYNPYFYYTDETLKFKLFTTTKNELYIIKSVK